LRVNKSNKVPKVAASQKYLVFSFERVQSGRYCFSNLEKNDKANVSEMIFRRKDFTMIDLIQSPKHGLGTEKIPVTSINAPMPHFIDKGSKLLSLRFSGKKPVIGYVVANIFYILWFDGDYTLYKH
jgi:hypothetical protein